MTDREQDMPRTDTSTVVKPNRLAFACLPEYAQFLLDNQLEAFAAVMLRVSREVQVPLLQYFAHLPETELVALSVQGARNLLAMFAQNRVQDFIELSVKNWTENQLPLIQSDAVVVEDISTISFTRRKVFRDFLPHYTSDLAVYIQTMEEVDRFTVALEEVCYKTLFDLKEQKINDHHHALEHREHLLQEAQEIANMGSFEWDLVGNNTTSSPQMAVILGTENRHAGLTNFLEYVHPYDRQRVREAIDKALTGDGIYECEYRYLKHGQEKIIWSRGVVSFDQGKPVKMKGTVMDVTQRQHTLKRLERSEELHKQAQAMSHIGNWSWYLVENKIEWSDEMYRIGGLTPQSEIITFERFTQLIHPDDRRKWQSMIQRSTDAQRLDDYVLRIVCDDGNLKIIQGKGDVLVDEAGEPYKILGTCQDITRQWLLNEQLKENEETFRQLIANAPDAVILIDADSNIVLWNPKAEEVFGWTAAEVIGRAIGDIIIPPMYRAAHLHGMQRLHDTGEIRVLNKTIEITALKKTGEEFYVALSISRSYQAGKQIFISFIRDISREKNAEIELQQQRNQIAQANIELERSNQELLAFNYIASHDLQEPVRKIQIFANRILGKMTPELPEPVRESMERIAGSASQMQKLIEALLSFSRATSAEKVFELTDLNLLLTEVETSLKEAIEEKQAIITATSLPTLPLISFQFSQLFENIISNALKYSRPDVPPRIHITAERMAGSYTGQEDAVPDQDYCKISMADNGIGFEQQYAGKVFELFQRLHNKNQYSGTGIGLAICKKIVENHQGFITAESGLGEGATFHIYIPYLLL